MMTKGELNQADAQAAPTSQALPSYPAMPQANVPGTGYPMQQMQTPPNAYPAAQQQLNSVPPQMTPQMDPAAAAAVTGQQYRDQLFAQCAMGKHERTTSYGVCGIITAVVCFPCGLICLFSDSEQKCARCGISLEGK